MTRFKKWLIVTVIFVSLTTQTYGFTDGYVIFVDKLQSFIANPPEQTEIVDIPTNTSAKTYEDGSLITDPSSKAYENIKQCYISESGHYMQDKYYAVAMGNYFNEVGSKYKVTLDTGNEFYIVKCDTKQDRHTTNKLTDSSGAMIEFIIDTNKASSYYGLGSNGYILNGNFNNTEEFKGYIVKMEEVKE